MSKIIINWEPGVTEIENIGLKTLNTLDKKGFYILLGGWPYASNITYERIEPIFVGASFNNKLRNTLTGYPEKNVSIQQFLDAHTKMELLFICGILKQPSSQAISPDNIQKVKNNLIAAVEPACNKIPSFSNDIEIEHEGMFEALVSKSKRL